LALASYSVLRLRCIGYLCAFLSGRGQDGATIKNHGGLALVQDPVEAPVPEMPAAALAQDDPEVLPTDQIAKRMAEFRRSGLRSRAPFHRSVLAIRSSFGQERPGQHRGD
jgi:chemotaxis response regulator CheB